jgi:hypothetical protein
VARKARSGVARRYVDPFDVISSSVRFDSEYDPFEGCGCVDNPL